MPQERRREIQAKPDEAELLHKTFYDREAAVKPKTFIAFLRGKESPMAEALTKKATIGERYDVIVTFAKKQGLNPLTVIDYALDLLHSGYHMEHAPFNLQTIMHLQKMLPRDHWEAYDAERLEGLAKNLRKREGRWHYYGKSQLSQGEIDAIAGKIEDLAKAVRKEISPKGGAIPPQAQQRRDKVALLTAKMEQMLDAHNSETERMQQQMDLLRQQLQEAQRAVQDAQSEHTQTISTS
ncbi:hypothetical protein HZC09_02125 [Candidatus Micrarchaeota archaeon]|nr:hypothetical protein [Candidatus Micrarchaeota archaeon]